MRNLTEDQVRDEAKVILGFENSNEAESGVGQITTFNELGFKGVNDRPDGWYLPKVKTYPAIILETKSTKIDLRDKEVAELQKNMVIAHTQYKDVIGILYNGLTVRAFKNDEEVKVPNELQNKGYYLSLFSENKIDKQAIYTLTSKINNCLHTEFGIKSLYHRMIFTACALVAQRYDAKLEKLKDMGYSTFHTAIHSTLSKSLEKSRKQNQKLDLLLEVYSEIKMNSTDNQKAINNFIDWVCEISENINSDYWNGEDVMGIFFNEFNRYKKKSDNGQVFTPDHITSLMYRILEVNENDYILDAACGSGAFLVKSMCNMIKESGGMNTTKAKNIKENQLFGIEFDREIYALACANMLIHKDGKTNLEQMDTRSAEACYWMKSKPITKVLMNPPFESKYGCCQIVKNVLDSVKPSTKCAFILPDKKLEKNKEKAGKTVDILNKHRLLKIIKLPENVFFEGVTTSIFIFESGVPQNNQEIFSCYIAEDGLETVKNQGRQDVRNKWSAIEDYWVNIIRKQSGDDTIQWIKPSEHLSYQMPEKEFEIFEEDFVKTMMDYLMFEQGIDVKDFNEKLTKKVIYSGNIHSDDSSVSIKISK